MKKMYWGKYSKVSIMVESSCVRRVVMRGKCKGLSESQLKQKGWIRVRRGAVMGHRAHHKIVSKKRHDNSLHKDSPLFRWRAALKKAAAQLNMRKIPIPIRKGTKLYDLAKKHFHHKEAAPQPAVHARPIRQAKTPSRFKDFQM